MAEERLSRARRVDADREVIDYHFHVTLDVNAPRVDEARVRELIETELRKLAWALKNRKP
jgi:hypothetical protein